VKSNQNAECSLNRNWMKLALDLNILLKNFSDTSNRKPRFEVSGLSTKSAIFLKKNFSAWTQLFTEVPGMHA
jgi:hypothetical protein